MNNVILKVKSYNKDVKRKTIPITKKIINCIRKNNSIYIIFMVQIRYNKYKILLIGRRRKETIPPTTRKWSIPILCVHKNIL